MRGHLHSLKSILSYQHEININRYMNLPDKVRATAVLAQAMAKASIQAELERKLAHRPGCPIRRVYMDLHRLQLVTSLPVRMTIVEADQRVNPLVLAAAAGHLSPL